jgi:uncharacterized membrane protein YphA (DoxX/SURF4 family)
LAEVALLARLVLAAVLALSAIAKAFDLRGSRAALHDFGLPQRFTIVAVLLPPIEVVLAAMLLIPATARWGAFGALGLLAVFTVAVAATLLRGARPNCHCFGQLDTGPIGGRTLVRNGALLLLAAVATYEGATAPRGWFTEATVPAGWTVLAAVVLFLALIGLAWLVFALWQQQGRLLARLDALEAGGTAIPVLPPARTTARAAPPAEGLPVDAVAPDVEGVDAEGKQVSLSRFWSRGKSVLVIFGDPACDACKALYPETAAWRTAHRSTLEVVLVTRAAGEDGAPAGLPVLVDTAEEARRAYRVIGTPSAVVISPSGKIASTLAPGASAIRELVETLTASPADRSPRRHAERQRRPAPPPVLAVGDVLPEVALEDPSGKRVSLPLKRGCDLLMLFWNDRCQHCDAMTPDLKAWNARRNGTDPEFAFVLPLQQQGAAAEAQFPGARILIDRGQDLMRALQIPGTPSAALVTEDGRLARDVAIGSDAILALLGAPERALVRDRLI